MLLADFLYAIALILIIYIIVNITSTGKATLLDAIAALGAVVLIILGLTIPSSSLKGPVENPIGDTTVIAGNWEGTIIGDTSDFSAELKLSIQAGCSTGNICGTEKIPQKSCSGNLKLVEISYRTFYFQEDSCGRGSEEITLFSNGKLSWTHQDGSVRSHATLSRK